MGLKYKEGWTESKLGIKHLSYTRHNYRSKGKFKVRVVISGALFIFKVAPNLPADIYTLYNFQYLHCFVLKGVDVGPFEQICS